MSMTGLALSGRTENCGDIVVSFDISLLREIEIAAVSLRLPSKGILQVLFGFGSPIVRASMYSFDVVLLIRVIWVRAGNSRPEAQYGLGLGYGQH